MTKLLLNNLGSHFKNGRLEVTASCKMAILIRCQVALALLQNRMGSYPDMAEPSIKLSAASAKAYTRKSKQIESSFAETPLKIAAVLFAGLMALVYQSGQPPLPKICGSPDGPPITTHRVKLSDGRHLAYKEHGVPRDEAKYKIVYVHGFDSCRHDALPLSQEVAEELGVYMVSFDRPGYGESDPHPKRTPKSIALDIEEFADQLKLGSKFYIIGFSMGGQVVWGCLKYIPHRLAGAALISPVVNYWWPGLPANVSNAGYKQQLNSDKWAVTVAHYFPWLTYWWNTQKWFPRSSVIDHNLGVFSPPDRVFMPQFNARAHYMAQIRQQGEFESLHRDMIVGFGSWDFSPMDLNNPFPQNEGSVHLWQGDTDWLVFVEPQRYIAEKLPWIHYHEVPNAGHLFLFAVDFANSIIKALLLGE